MNYSILNISQTEEKGHSFVGVSNIKDSDKTRIVVPYGYSMPSVVKEDDAENMAALKRYVKVVQKALRTYKATREDIDLSKGLNSPLAAVNIIQDYLSMGEYIEYEKEYVQSSKGKIDFKKTIKQVRPEIINGRLFYKDFITQRRAVIKDNLIALVQGNIINHFMKHGGDVLFGHTLKVNIAPIDLNAKTVRLLREELLNTFNSRKQSLIRWSIEYINSLMNPDYEEKGEWNYAIVAHSLWEIIVDYVFGSKDGEDRSKYGKKYSAFNFNNKVVDTGNKTIHDTIYKDDEWLFVIDSKMYQTQHNLLSEENLGKQFGYFIEARNQNPGLKVANFFLLPYVGGKEGFQNYYIQDPHVSPESDPDRIIFVYTCKVNDLIDDYYYGRKRTSKIKDDFVDFIARPDVRKFLDERKVTY